MSQQYALLLCHDGSRHCRSEVVNDNNDVCRMLLKITLEGRHNLTRKLVEVNAVDTQAYIWATDLKIVEERRLECGVVVATCVNQTAAYLLAFSLSLVNGTNDWGYLNEVGTCANKYTNVHILLFAFNLYFSVSLNNSFIPPRLPSMFVASNGRNTVFVLSPCASSSIILMYFCASR